MEFNFSVLEMRELIPAFNGEKKNYIRFREVCNIIWSNTDLKKEALIIIKLRMADWPASEMSRNMKTWDEVMNSLDEVFLIKDSREWLAAQMQGFRQYPEENLLAYRQRAWEIVRKICDLIEDQDEFVKAFAEFKFKFIHGLHRESRAEVKCLYPKSIDETYDLAVSIQEKKKKLQFADQETLKDEKNYN